MIDDRRLIAEIRNHPLLYDPGVPENRDVNAKESTWNYIGKTLGYTGTCSNPDTPPANLSPSLTSAHRATRYIACRELCLIKNEGER